MSLMNLMNICKSASYNQKTLIILIKFIKTPYSLKNVNSILMRMMRAKYQNVSALISFIISSIFFFSFV